MKMETQNFWSSYYLYLDFTWKSWMVKEGNIFN